MNFTRMRPSLKSIDELRDYEAICGFTTFEDRPLSGALGFVDWRLGGFISKNITEYFFSAGEAEHLLLPSHGRLPVSRIFVFGLGSVNDLDAERFEDLAFQAFDVLARAGVTSGAVSVPTFPRPLSAYADESIEACLERTTGGPWTWFYSEDEDVLDQ